jgi:alpha-L-rhamnosidase
MLKRFLPHLLFLWLICQTALAIEPYSLTCEYISNPLGIDTFQPVLGWKLSSGEQNQSQTAYEIQVALSENDLAQGKNSVWKTGKKLSSQSFNIPTAVRNSSRLHVITGG